MRISGLKKIGVVASFLLLQLPLTTMAGDKKNNKGCDCGTVEFHTGVDLDAPQGAPIKTQDDGVVVKVEENEKAATYSSTGGFCGRYIVIRHSYVNGKSVFTRYAQLGKIENNNGGTIRPGDKVKAGDKIGVIGKTGLLHFEVRPVTSKPNATTSVFYSSDPTMEWTKYQPVNPNDFDFDKYSGQSPQK